MVRRAIQHRGDPIRGDIVSGGNDVDAAVVVDAKDDVTTRVAVVGSDEVEVTVARKRNRLYPVQKSG